MNSRQSSALNDRRIAFFGDFAFWPSYHGAPPQDVARRHGAILQQAVDEDLDILVLGDKRGAGRADAKKKAERLQRRNSSATSQLEILDEAAFRELVRVDVTGKRFCFTGGFDCCPKDFDEQLLANMVSAIGGVVTNQVDVELDFLVIGNRRGPGKTQAERTARELTAGGARLTVIDEQGFLELARKESASDERQIGFASLVGNFYGVVNDKKLQRALKMLQTEQFQLFANISDEHLYGIVKSQTQASTLYAPWLNSKGQYGCYSHDLQPCMGLQGSICKHLLVLVLGLTRNQQIPTQIAWQWVSQAAHKRPKANDDLSADALLQYKGVIAGEFDWRPTETVPEDFYAL